MTTINSLDHTIIRDGIRARKGIGLFTSAQRPNEVIKSLQGKPGFRDPRGSFSQSQVTVGGAYLPNGYDAGSDKPITFPGVETVIRDGHLFQLAAVNLVDAPETDDDFVLIGLFTTKADALKVAALVQDQIDPKRYRLEVFDSYTDRIGFSTGFGFEG